MAAAAPLTTTSLLHGHELDVTHVAVCGDSVVSAAGDNTLRIWSLTDVAQKHVLKEHTQAITGLDLNARDGLAASCSWDGSAKLWSVLDGSCKATYSQHSEWLRDIRWSPDYKRVATCSGDTTVHLWDAETQQQQLVLTGHQDWVATCCFVSETEQLVSTGWDATVRLWDLATGAETHRLGTSTVVARHIASATSHPAHVSLGYVDGSIRTFDIRQPDTAVGEMTQHTASITRLATHGTQLVSASSDNTCRVWEVDQCVRSFTGHNAWVSDLAVTDDGTCVSCSGDGMTLVWDIATGGVLARGKGAGASLCCAAGCDDESVYVVTGAQTGDITAMTVPSLAVSRAAARPNMPQLGQSTGDWFLKKGGWRVTAGIQLTGRKRRYCVLAGDCIKYFTTVDDDGTTRGLKGAIELNKATGVQRKEARLLIVNKDRTWDLLAESEAVAERWQADICSIIEAASGLASP
eukprot:m.54205 g.54205  ORF g.54205 m.54205 type:complete len:464 (+) comp13608_c0_seq1:208-1599(+)